MSTGLIFTSMITCPECDFATNEEMPENSCQFFWKCPECENIIKPKVGDCCVFCSYGNIPCPPVQAEKNCC
ncbi:GDCCVxC domain-containing (seleno)protein [Gracilimonas mengyeensis]|uniref:GDCCVxC domain-containing (seleno)protein n=1 Tax=Gracilimonas mengyeensis TaxID=1302730 RepID=UPI00319E56DE